MKWFVILGIAVCLLFAGLAWAEVNLPDISPLLPQELTSEEEAKLNELLGLSATASTNEITLTDEAEDAEAGMEGLSKCLKGAWVKKCDPYFFYCNCDPTITVQVKASIAQWAAVYLSATKIKWFVLKPGCYWTDCMTGFLVSNGEVVLTFKGFENLKNKEGDEIPVYYAYWQIKPAPGGWSGWIAAADVNGSIDEPPLSEGAYVWKLYNLIHVPFNVSACEYADPEGATIKVSLTEQKRWVYCPPCPS